MTGSPEGRRVLVAVVTGEVGEAIQAWRREHDPVQARRLPPHATLCYWAPESSNAELLEQQVRHAFDRPVAVQLSGVHEFDNPDGTFYVGVTETGELDRARTRLYDGRFLALTGTPDFTWHVTCVRYPDDARRSELRAAAANLAEQIAGDPVWQIQQIAWLELRDGIYQPVATWSV